MLSFALALLVATVRCTALTNNRTLSTTERSLQLLVHSFGDGAYSDSNKFVADLPLLNGSDSVTDKSSTYMAMQSIRHLILAVSNLLGINTPQNITLGQLNLALSSRMGNNIATGMLAHAYQRGGLQYPRAETLAHLLYHELVDAWVSGAVYAYPYEYNNVDPLQLARYGFKHEADALSSAELEYMIDEAGSDPESGQALVAVTGFLTGDNGFPKSTVFLARFAAIAAIVDGTGQDGEPGLFDLTAVNTKLYRYLSHNGPNEHSDGFYHHIPTIPGLDLYKYRANLALSNHAYIEAIVQIVRAAEALLVRRYPETFGLPKNITYAEYLANPRYNIKTSNSTLIREAISIYLRRSRGLVPFVAAIEPELTKRLNTTFEEYVRKLAINPMLTRSPRETCTRRGQAFGIVASTLFSNATIPEEYMASTFVLQATRILYLMAAYDGCHMGISGLAYQALSGYHIPEDDYIHQNSSGAHMYPVSHYASLKHATLQHMASHTLVPAKLVGFTHIRKVSELDITTPRMLEAIVALDIASIAGNFEASFYLSSIFARKIPDFSVRSFGLSHLWWTPIAELIEKYFKNTDLPIYKNCNSSSINFYANVPVNIKFVTYLANHSAGVGNLGGQIASGYYLYAGLENMPSNISHGNIVWNAVARRIAVRDYVLQYLKKLSSSKVSERREIFSAYLANGMLGCHTSIKNAAKMLLGRSNCQSFIPFNLRAKLSADAKAKHRSRSRSGCLLPDLTMYGSNGRSYSGKEADVFLAASLLANFCTAEDPGCAMLMGRAIKMSSEAALDALFEIDVQADDVAAIGSALYKTLTADGALMQYYIKHRLGVVSPKYRSAALLQSLTLTKQSQALANIRSSWLASKLQTYHNRLVRYYSVEKLPYKHVAGFNHANVVTSAVSLFYNIVGYTYSCTDIFFKLMENKLIKPVLKGLDMLGTLFYVRILRPTIISFAAALRPIVATYTTIKRTVYGFGTILAKVTGMQGNALGKDLDLQTRLQTSDGTDTEQLTIQNEILGGSYGSSAYIAQANKTRLFHSNFGFSDLLDICYMVPYLMSQHGKFDGSSELLNEHITHLPYCLQLTSLLSTESAHILMQLYSQGPSKKLLTEFVELDMHQYLSELDNALLNIQLHYLFSDTSYLCNYIKGVLLPQRVELGYETKRNKDFRNMLAYQSNELLALFESPAVLPGVTSSLQFKTMTRAAFNRLANTLTLGMQNRRASLNAYPEVNWDHGHDFNWQLLNSVHYTPLFTLQTLLAAALKVKEYAAQICVAACALYYLIIYDSFFATTRVQV